MKYFLTFLLFFSIFTFTTEHSLKRVTVPSTEKLISTLDEKHYSLAHKIGGKTLYPIEVLMAIHSFYNGEDDLSEKSEHFKKDMPTLIEKILSDYPDTVACFKKNIFKI